MYATAIDTSKQLTVTPSGSLQVGTINPTQAETLTITGSDKLELNGQLVLDVFSQNEIDQINFASGTPIYGSSATLALNLVYPDQFDPSGVYTLQISDLGSDALNVRILGRNDLVGWMLGTDSVIFGSANSLPEPGTWALLLLGFGVMLTWKRPRK
ncbi:MAG: PEP-CTERM sorting domain-containing protein [Thermoguttaceae bacterium]|nr:PEP-CTERM sorting domain-containing protein [Thermoguttaceae bacterium]